VLRAEARRRGIAVRIARKGIESSQRLTGIAGSSKPACPG